jgi:hypothetical protein
VQQAIAVIKRDGLQPVIVVDDSDRWLASGARPTPEPIVTAFFGDVLGEVAQLDCSLVVAVHPHYRDMLPRPSGVLVPINVPTLPDATALELMLQGRAHRCGAEEGLAHILAPDALDHSFRHDADQGSFNIRRMLAVLHNALLHSQQGRGGRITVDDTAYAVGRAVSRPRTIEVQSPAITATIRRRGDHRPLSRRSVSGPGTARVVAAPAWNRHSGSGVRHQRNQQLGNSAAGELRPGWWTTTEVAEEMGVTRAAVRKAAEIDRWKQ